MLGCRCRFPDAKAIEQAHGRCVWLAEVTKVLSAQGLRTLVPVALPELAKPE
jgi:hypothetical protein